VASAQVANEHHIAERLRHLLALVPHHPGVDPETGEGPPPGERLALGDLALVVRVDQVGAAAVDLEPLSEVMVAHRAALDVPAGPAGAPGRLPARLVRQRSLPEDEIERVLLA